MWNYKDSRVLILVSLSLFVFCTNVTLAQSTDDASLVRSVVTNFFAAYQGKDIDGLTALWSSKAPEKEAFTMEVRKTLSDAGGPELKRTTRGNKATEWANAG